MFAGLASLPSTALGLNVRAKANVGLPTVSIGKRVSKLSKWKWSCEYVGHGITQD